MQTSGGGARGQRAKNSFGETCEKEIKIILKASNSFSKVDTDVFT